MKLFAIVLICLSLLGCAASKTRTYGVCIDYSYYCDEDDYEYICKDIEPFAGAILCTQANGVKVIIQGNAVIEEIWTNK